MEQTAVEATTERRILDDTMRQATSRTRVSSPRQLPTNHDHAGAPSPGRSANIRVINRRRSRLGCRLLHPRSRFAGEDKCSRGG
jgi:hypothetical protein